MNTPAPLPLGTGPVLVTGGTGFLGRHLVDRLLAQGRPVTVLARKIDLSLSARGVSFITCPLADTEQVAEACRGQEAVYHVAAKVGVWGPYEDFFTTNVGGTRALLRGAVRHGVRRFIHTSTPSVVYNGRDLAGADESLPLTTSCPSPYPLTKAIAEREVLAANSPSLRTVALRPHLIWGPGDPHLVPRVLDRARRRRLRIIGRGMNRVDMVHVENATDAHILAENALLAPNSRAAGKAYFITNAEPVFLWQWINGLLTGLDLPPVREKMSLPAALVVGSACETVWRLARLRGDPPLTRFVAAELAKDHWFSPHAATVELGYRPRLSMEEGTRQLLDHLRSL